MTILSGYTFRGIPRFSFYWENPNHAAAVIICLLPLLWGAQRICFYKCTHYSVFLILAGLEITLNLALGLTLSRGGILALVVMCTAAGLYWARYPSNPATRRWYRYFCASRVVLLAGLLLVPGLASRVYSVLQGDLSAMNRLSIWSSGLQLIGTCPLAGWGRGNSGAAYVQWLQSTDHLVPTYGMTNSYLLTAVEFGLPVFTFSLCGFLVPCLSAAYAAQREGWCRSEVLRACLFSLTGFLIASVFTSLWFLRGVMWAPLTIVILMLVMSYRTVGSVFGSKILRPALLLSVSLSLVLFGIGTAIGQTTEKYWTFNKLPSGATAFLRKDSSSAGRFLIFCPDFSTLGPYYGFQIRHAMHEGKLHDYNYLVVPPGTSLQPVHSGRVILFGARTRELGLIENTASACLVCPVDPPPAADSCKANVELIVLPEFDAFGVKQEWQSWATLKGARISILPGTGQDIRGAFTEQLVYLATNFYFPH